LTKTILVAEDRETSRELVRTVLSSAGYTVVEAADGQQAIEQASRVQADLVILDLYMPFVDGFGVLEHLRRDEHYRNIPVVALTASAMSGDSERALASGFTAYISKPVKMTELRREIERLLAENFRE
jgi:two-component system, cell cycle response regulator DivK